jgi:F420-0:gamma-glutamyl ligase-like protein
MHLASDQRTGGSSPSGCTILNFGTMDFQPNENKKLEIKVEDKVYARLPIRSHIISKDDNIETVVEKYVKPYLKKDDLIFISEKIVAISQGRAFPISEIKAGKLANFLIKFVHNSPYGIGLKSPWTMQLAIEEAGAWRILFAAALSAVTKPFGIRGVFYKAVGKNVNAIDGPCDYTLPPYNKYAKLGPAKPHQVAREIKEKLGNEVVIIDANDLGAEILGKSKKDLSDDFCKAVFKDNPLGQTNEQTPLCIVREVK